MPTTYTNRVLTILIVLWVAFSAIYPHLPGSLFWAFHPGEVSTRQALKPGIDMVGGTSLTYEIKQPESGGLRPNLAEEVTDALKNRVDSTGVKNLIWRPQGSDRLEIQMPLTRQSAESVKLRDDYAAARDALEATNLRVPAVLDELSATPPGPALDAKIKQFAGDSKTRSDLLTRIAALQARLKAARDAKDYDASATALQQLTPLENKLADTSLPVATVESALELGGEQRANRIAELKKQAADSPARLAALEKFIAAHDAVAHLGGDLDSADELKRLLRGSGVLSFHILADDLDPATYQQWVQRLQQNGPRPQPGDTLRWFQNGRDDQGGIVYNGKRYSLVHVDADHSLANGPGLPKWNVETVRAGTDQRTNGAAVEMSFDATGGRLFGDLTGRYRARDNRQYRLAIVLDDKLISAPTLPSSPIFGNVQISGGGGGFGKSELDYLITTLGAGSLPAQLTDEPISEVTVGPQLGADNLRAGLVSCVLGLVIVFVFLAVYYYVSGLVAFVAVLANLVMIVGAMALINATFTLPGVAGIVLSVAIAVDANVLIFERLREEQARGLGLKLALRNSYDRAFSAILDGQVTTAISSAFLFVFGSEEVKGFGLTLLIGIVTSLFTALYVTKTIFGLMVDKLQVKDLSSLPRTFPKWNKLLTPNIDWMKLSWAFVTFSVVFITGGLICFGVKLAQGQALDIEFSGGTAVRVELKDDANLDRAAVQQLVDDESAKKPNDLAAPRVVAIGSDSRHFEISTPTTDAQSVQRAVIEAIGPKLDIASPSTFRGVNDSYEAAENTVVYPIESAQTQIDGVSGYLLQSHVGGAAVVLNDLKPALSAKQIRARILARAEQEKADQRPEQVEVDTFDNDTRAVVVFSDSRYAYDATDNAKQQAWRGGLAAPAWQITKDAVNNPPKLGGVTSFNAQVANQAKWNTTLALVFSILGIMAYIWVRFGNFKFGTATVVAALHDALFVVAAIGFSHYIGAIGLLEKALLIHPFRMDLTLVAAVLTVLGYSLNDTVVIFDRVRENRGKFGLLSRKVVNDSINQTFSRTLLTGGTSMGILLVMYVLGGEGIHGFTFVMLLGIIVGTYSSIAVACPLLLLGKSPQPAGRANLPAAKAATAG